MVDELGGELKVPLSVLDRFVTLSKENSAAYGAMVTALDQMASKTMDVTDRMGTLEATVRREQLGKVVSDAVADMKNQTQAMGECVGALALPRYNVLKALAEHLQFSRASDEEVQTLVKDTLFLVSVAGFFRRRRISFAFLMGILLVSLLGTTGMTLWDAVQFVISK